MSAQILPFVTLPRSRTASRKTDAAEALSTVIILPCVRYERWGDDDLHAEMPGRAPALASGAHH